MSHRLMPTKTIPLVTDRADALMRDGYLLLRGAVPEGWRDALRGAFDAGVCSGERWAAPRGAGWRHALVDLDPIVQRTCRLPPLLAAAAINPCTAMVWAPRRSQPWSSSTITGATRLVPRPLDCGEPDEASSLITVGEAGDVLVFDADLPHGATRNRSGARRRSLLLSFMPERMCEAQESSRALRNVRMDTSEMFLPGERSRPV
ncbi:phytanoyl-CoA dioxygenase family protein [Bradyrhizobium arachidis]|uniref:phytanoyl-CoA dioxygenase family protein n=1 Tax=Bradyrhizobium arachidis TaxID=858423 RepID=UPI002162C887|nr:phytanoyl-CoA dioxygenase family protein [Bradyrhizobium arachidis]